MPAIMLTVEVYACNLKSETDNICLQSIPIYSTVIMIASIFGPCGNKQPYGVHPCTFIIDFGTEFQFLEKSESRFERYEICHKKINSEHMQRLKCLINFTSKG